MIKDRLDSAIINVPLSSPLHPKANLVFLSSWLRQHGYVTQAFDTNVQFFNWMLKDYEYDFKAPQYMDDPVALLGLYNEVEGWLAEESKKYRGLAVDLRTIGFAYDRLQFEEVLKAIDDSEANPFIAFYDEFILQQLKPKAPRIVGIGITFQDNIIAAFTLASRLRLHIPETTIVLGGQMITRCYDTMLECGSLNHLWDHLVCWDGEIPMLELHNALLRDQPADLTNVISCGKKYDIDRAKAAFDLDTVDTIYFDDIDFDDYLFPDMLIPLQTARGCYGKCEFCAIPMGSNTGFRERSVAKIIEDIKYTQTYTLGKYGRAAQYFKFMDDTSSPKTLLGIAQGIEKENIDAKWETYVRMEIQFQDRDLMKQLYRGGCRKLMWGLETNDPEILKNMSKKISPVSTSEVLDAAHEAGILNFVFVLLGFPGETQPQRDALAEFISNKESIHVLTLATFDVTKWSRIETQASMPAHLHLECDSAKGFEVRLPYMVNGENWKKMIVSEAHKFMVKVLKIRPDIGLVSLFPDQVRASMTDQHGNTWGKKYLASFGEDKIKALLTATENYMDAFSNNDEIELAGLPDPIKREHIRTREDINAIASAIQRRKKYEERRSDSI